MAGCGIVVTRPVEQAGNLEMLLRARGAEPIAFPVLEIREVADLGPLLSTIDRLEIYDFAVFISPTAVSRAMNLIKSRRTLPPLLVVAAVGQGSVRELRRLGVTEVLAPKGRFDSEALLELPQMQQMAGRRVLIFRGEGGRELLGDTLAARGASVDYAECYRRAKPDADAAGLLRRWARSEVHGVTVTSSEGVHNLFDMVGRLGQQWLKKTPLFAPHERIAATARGLGLERVIATAGGDEGLVEGMLRWFAENPPAGGTFRQGTST